MSTSAQGYNNFRTPPTIADSPGQLRLSRRADIDRVIQHVLNHVNPWLSTSVEYIGEPPLAETEVSEEEATRTTINKVKSPDAAGFMPRTVSVYRA
jgi:hypothetical protein